MSVRIINADVIDGLRQLDDESVHCVVTSPPYFGLRDYGMDDQIGLEATPAEYVARMVEVFREVRRVLRKDGVCWLNLGDSYAAARGGTHQPAETLAGGKGGKASDGSRVNRDRHDGYNPTRNAHAIGMKHKDMIGIPWRVAFALQEDGWWLRQDIIWSKPNPMPESVTDRCTKAHEYVFMLTKSARYAYDAEAIKEPASFSGGRTWEKRKADGEGPRYGLASAADAGAVGGFATGDERNKRSVWSIATQPFSDAHFATMPPELAETCIKAGCPKGGTVLDPFGGAGTTGLVADRLQRSAILIELNPEYAAMARKRIDSDRGSLLDAMEAAE